MWKTVDILWSEQAIIRKQHPFVYYRDLLTQETAGEEGLICSYDGRLVGILAIGALGPDSHFPGEGRIVHYAAVSRSHPQATRLLYRYLVNLIREKGGSWYQTTRRVSEFEFHTKFRRIHG